MIDGIALRSRAAIFSQYVRRAAQQVDGRMHLLSLGSGAAVPVLDALATIGETADSTHDLVLVDLDPSALAFAVELAGDAGLVDRLRVVNDNIVRAGRHLPRHHFDLVDLLGVWEYGSDRACASLIRSALERLAPGGRIVVSNMLLSRPQLQLNQRGVGWPAVVPRTVTQMVEIALSAGVDPADIEISVPEDGVYAVMVIGG
ncbi:class I SAM-dependent methyltransferase [Rathayibacter oskolensis]|uniref:SAM-dependent methyltransferase n=1 Tax=Rathayibacter oskolensis TaxID=1891671 RepID=UPI00265E68ED|nr:class I SAM-dependent methyltransferase [Rathayibacter oskolensis]WKK73104.1 class I SAM-dependent methyltransferase [Rathayibacter oskolensis]